MMPRSLFGRTALLIGALLLVGQLTSALLVRQLIARPRIEQITASVQQNVDAIRAGLAALPPGQRVDFLRAWNSHRIALSGLEPRRVFTGAWLAASLASAGLSLVGALWIQRRLDRPLRRVVEAARSIGRGSLPPPLPEDGPEETVALSRSINQMTASLGRAERERALMLAGLSHDLRTPMAKLRLGLEILGDQTEPGLRASMTRSIEEMDAIVGQFLDFARAGDAEPFIEGDLGALLSEVVAALADQGREVTLTVGASRKVRMRPQSLRRATLNLIENAFRHGRPPVEVTTGTDAVHVWIDVRDHGRGIAPAEIDRVREPFRRGSAARDGTAGAGLGLAIVERVMRSHDGALRLTPLPDGLLARLEWPLRP